MIYGGCSCTVNTISFVFLQCSRYRTLVCQSKDHGSTDCCWAWAHQPKSLRAAPFFGTFALVAMFPSGWRLSRLVLRLKAWGQLLLCFSTPVDLLGKEFRVHSIFSLRNLSEGRCVHRTKPSCDVDVGVFFPTLSGDVGKLFFSIHLCTSLFVVCLLIVAGDKVVRNISCQLQCIILGSVPKLKNSTAPFSAVASISDYLSPSMFLLTIGYIICRSPVKLKQSFGRCQFWVALLSCVSVYSCFSPA